MTRINAGVRPRELPTQLLVAEWNELPRIPTLCKGNPNLKGLPTEFTLGTGHVRFFYNKLLYLEKRYLELFQESKRRALSFFNDVTEIFDRTLLPHEFWWNDWQETEQARKLVVYRITVQKGYELCQ